MNNRADKACKERLVLLEKKYTNSDLSDDAHARLESLTELLRRLIPRVTSDNFLKLKGGERK